MFQLRERIEWISRLDWEFKQNLWKSLSLELDIEKQTEWDRYDS